MVDRLVNSEANARRIKNVEACFGGSGQPLLVPGRVLVGEGVLTKLCRKGPKARQFFLFNDVLIYGNILLNKKKYNKQHVLPLEDIKLTPLDDDGNLKNGWQIKNPKKSFAVYAATSTEKAEWMAHINKCINDLLTKSGKRPQSQHAAIWVPDSEANICMLCTKTKFTTLNRRHHCRNCGQVVCGNCSSKKWLLPLQSSHPLRVCDTCYEELSAKHTDVGNVYEDEAESKPPKVDLAPELPPKEHHDIGSGSSSDGTDDEILGEQSEYQVPTGKPTFYPENKEGETAQHEEEKPAEPMEE